MLSITHGGTTGQSFQLMTHSIKVKAIHKQILKSFKAQDEFTFKKKKKKKSPIHFSKKWKKWLLET